MKYRNSTYISETTTFNSKSGQALAQFAQRGPTLSILGDIQNLTRHHPEQLPPADSALRRGPGLKRLPDSIIMQFSLYVCTCGY